MRGESKKYRKLYGTDTQVDILLVEEPSKEDRYSAGIVHMYRTRMHHGYYRFPIPNRWIPQIACQVKSASLADGRPH